MSASLLQLPRLLRSSAKLPVQSFRDYSKSLVACHGDHSGPETLTIRWINKDGSEKKTPAAIGATLLQVAHRHGIELEGACEGVCACSTCHVILQPDDFDALPEPSEEEEDMLDRAFGLTQTSRLGCQIKLEEHHDGLLVKLPKATRNFYVDGHVPKPH